jgi:hypothetical protein
MLLSGAGITEGDKDFSVAVLLRNNNVTGKENDGE